MIFNNIILLYNIMAEEFNEDDREDLIERGFNSEQLEYLESLEMDTEGLYADICHIMDDFGDTAEQIIESYREANNDNNPQQYAALQGGRRRSKKSRKGRTRKGRTRKGRTRKGRSRKSRRSMKNKRSRKSRR